ncbi:MAG: acyl carrier protein [Bryobacterales bacterium]|nr:acyl carrier protein [Bryobacterales bacterium]
MSREELLRSLDQMIELPAGTLQGSELLDDLELWDSVAMMTFMAAADEHCGVKLSPRDFTKCSTVDDLIRLALGNA